MNTTSPAETLLESTSTTSAYDGIEKHRDHLLSNALTYLRSRDQAEDVVQETFLAAIASERSFSGSSSRKTWLTGILKHKVVDRVRKACRERAIFSSDDVFGSADDLCEPLTMTFPLCAWPRDPRVELEGKELHEAFLCALDRLPERLAKVFSLYENEERSGREICKELQISENNLWTILHRARKQLREHLSGWDTDER